MSHHLPFERLGYRLQGNRRKRIGRQRVKLVGSSTVSYLQLTKVATMPSNHMHMDNYVSIRGKGESKAECMALIKL